MTETSSVSPILLSVEQTMQVMNWTRTRVAQAVRDGDVQSFRQGKRRLIVAASLHDYVDRQLQPSTDRMLRPRARSSEGRFAARSARAV